jgi:hypothetical protein
LAWHPRQSRQLRQGCPPGSKNAGLSTVMHDAVFGEHIARITASPNVVDCTGAKAYEGRFDSL